MHPQRQNKHIKTSTSLKSGWFSFYLLLSLVFFWLLPVHSGFAKTEDSTSKLIEYLVQEKNKLTLAINEIKLIPPPVDQASYQRQLQENNAMMALNQAKITSFESFLTNQKQLQQNFSQRLKNLQQTSLSQTTQINSQERIGKINTLTDVNKKTIELINENLALATRYQDALVSHKQQLDLWYSKALMQEQVEKLHHQKDKFNQSLARLYEHTIKLQQDIRTDAAFSSVYMAEAKLLLNNQVINLTQYKIAELDLQKRLVKADYLLLKDPNIRTLQKVAETYKEAIIQLSNMEQSLKKIVSMLTDERAHLTDENLKKQFSALIRIVNARIEGVVIQQQTLQEDLENHQAELKKQLSVRQSFSEYRIDSWPIIFQQIVHIPTQFYNYLKSLALKVKDNYLWLDFFPATLLWTILGLIILGSYGLYKLLKQLTRDKERSRLSGHLYDGALILLSRNIPSSHPCCSDDGRTLFQPYSFF
ncbi:hypothetical protein [Legionella hackeliae]|uniref:Potassium efflux system KefA n=1 Tax=Legionella hackeliae TaxID=449 RepID=A0A0A8UPQ8_LEGHA